MSAINILLFRKSLFYAPIVAAVHGPFLKDEGLKPSLAVATAERTVRGGLLDGSVDVGQGAVSQSWPLLEKGTDPGFRHFAQVNCRDGFFLVGKTNAAFSWNDLAGARVLVDHGAQPLTSFKYACHCKGVDYKAIEAIDAGRGDRMVEAFADGETDFVHLQAPAAQEAAASAGRIVASVGEAIGPIAFTSLMATRRWIESAQGGPFMRGMAATMAAMAAWDPKELAAIVKPGFADVEESLLRDCLGDYQKLGTWSGSLEIPRSEYDVALDAFLHAGVISRRCGYDEVVSNVDARKAA